MFNIRCLLTVLRVHPLSKQRLVCFGSLNSFIAMIYKLSNIIYHMLYKIYIEGYIYDHFEKKVPSVNLLYVNFIHHLWVFDVVRFLSYLILINAFCVCVCARAYTYIYKFAYTYMHAFWIYYVHLHTHTCMYSSAKQYHFRTV